MNMEQRTPEWFAARKGRITASLVGGLLGLAPYMSSDAAYRALVRSVHDLPDEFSGNIATDYGTNNEPLALQAYEMETGNTVEEIAFVPRDGWAGASPDGLVGDDRMLEIKCPFGLRKDDDPVFKSINDQLHYYAQVQFQMWCADRQYVDFFQWSPNGHRLERVEINHVWLNKNLPKLQALWWKAKGENPADFDGPLRSQIDTPKAEMLIAEYDDLSEAIENASQRKKEVLAEIVQMCGETDSEVCGRKVTKVVRKGSVSYAKALAKYAPDADLEPFRGKPSESWRLT